MGQAKNALHYHVEGGGESAATPPPVAKFRQLRAQPFPEPLGVPRRMRDEMLKGLIGAGIAEARPHGFHRLAPTVAQQTGHIPPQRAALTLTRKAGFEELQPRQQPAQPRRRGSIHHRCAGYRITEKSTMPSKVIT